MLAVSVIDAATATDAELDEGRELGSGEGDPGFFNEDENDSVSVAVGTAQESLRPSSSRAAVTGALFGEQGERFLWGDTGRSRSSTISIGIGGLGPGLWYLNSTSTKEEVSCRG